MTEKEREESVRKYRNNPKYEVIPSFDCSSRCKYRPYHGECIYKKNIITLKVLVMLYATKKND